MSGDPTAGAALRPLADGWGVLLPSSWWSVPLATPQGRRKGIAALVEEQVGRADQHAGLRADLRRHLEQAADDAAAAGGRILAVSLMRAGGVPVPATLTVYRVPGAGLLERGVAEMHDVLAADDGAADALELAEGPSGAVLRRVTRRPGAASVGGQGVELLLADYWVDPGDGRGPLCLSFSTPLVGQAPAMLELFDVIVASVGPAGGASASGSADAGGAAG